MVLFVLDNFWFLLNFNRVVMGLVLGDNIKISGVQQLELVNDFGRLKVGGLMQDCFKLFIMKFWIVGIILLGRNILRIIILFSFIRILQGEGSLCFCGVRELYIFFYLLILFLIFVINNRMYICFRKLINFFKKFKYR